MVTNCCWFRIFHTWHCWEAWEREREKKNNVRPNPVVVSTGGHIHTHTSVAIIWTCEKRNKNSCQSPSNIKLFSYSFWNSSSAQNKTQNKKWFSCFFPVSLSLYLFHSQHCFNGMSEWECILGFSFKASLRIVCVCLSWIACISRISIPLH